MPKKQGFQNIEFCTASTVHLFLNRKLVFLFSSRSDSDRRGCECQIKVSYAFLLHLQESKF